MLVLTLITLLGITATQIDCPYPWPAPAKAESRLQLNWSTADWLTADVPLVRPSDYRAVQRIAFLLGKNGRWMDWALKLPLGSYHWEFVKQPRSELQPQEQLERLQEFMVRPYYRDKTRDRVRNETTGAVSEDGWMAQLSRRKDDDWLQWLRGKLSKHQEPIILPSSHIANLQAMLDHVLLWVEYEDGVMNEYSTRFANLTVLSDSKMRILTSHVHHIVVKAVRRHLEEPDPALEGTAIVRLLDNEEGRQIAQARAHYGVVTFLSLLAHALHPAMCERRRQTRETLMTLRKMRAESGKCTERDVHSTAAELESCVIATIEDMRHRLQRLQPFLDNVAGEKHVTGIFKHADAWLKKRMLPVQKASSSPSHHATDIALFQQPRQLLSTCSSFLTTLPISPEAAAGAESLLTTKLFTQVWLHPTIGAASWHWEGSGPNFDWFTFVWEGASEEALTYAGLVVEDMKITWSDGVRLLPASQRWEFYRYTMVPRKDGQDIRICSPTAEEKNPCLRRTTRQIVESWREASEPWFEDTPSPWVIFEDDK